LDQQQNFCFDALGQGSGLLYPDAGVGAWVDSGEVKQNACTIFFPEHYFFGLQMPALLLRKTLRDAKLMDNNSQ
jgi:hypothetical protein